MAIDQNFLTGFLGSFGQQLQNNRERAEREEMKKLQIKMFKKDLEDKEKQEAALKQVFDAMKGVETLPADFTGPPKETKKMDILDLLSGADGQRLLMQAGTKPADIINMQTYANLMGGAGNIPEGMVLEGVKLDSRGRPMYDYGTDPMDKPVSPSASLNYVDEQGRPAPPGLTIRQLQGGGYKPKGPDITPAEAGRITALDTATEYSKDLSSTILDPNLSKTERTLLLTNMAARTPKTKGRELYFKMRDAVDALFRARTGSAAPESEATAILSQFMPSPFDADAGIVDKLDRFDKFVGGSLDIITLPENVRLKLQGGKKNSSGPQPGDEEDGYRFKGGDASDPANWEKM